MRLLSCSAWNFGSYDFVTIDLQNKALNLIAGPTGSGKSTLLDMAPWCLFGVTGKGGQADDVLGWQADSDTMVLVSFEHKGKIYDVSRVRGPRMRDLTYSKVGEPHIRGKDIKDTQKRINDLLGLDADLYLASSYYHEFSQTASFFTANAKTRRLITEQLVDLALPKLLAENTSEYKKSLKNELDELHKRLTSQETKVELYKDQIKTAKSAWEAHELKIQNQQALTQLATDQFERQNKEKVKDLERAYQENYSIVKQLQSEIQPDDVYKQQLQVIDAAIDSLSKDVCKECGSAKHSSQVLVLTKDRHKVIVAKNDNASKKNIVRLNEAQLGRLAQELEAAIRHPEPNAAPVDEGNPFSESLENSNEELKKAIKEVASTKAIIQDMQQNLDDAKLLSDVTDSFRSHLVKTTIASLETSTNSLLIQYFDAEIKVAFAIADADKLEITITKDGNQCSYPQLSKGQRQLLKLCFGISVMRTAANHHGVHPSSIFFDEAFDGLDSDKKMQAFRMLESLTAEYESVFFIDHSSDIRSMCNNVYEVTLENGHSRIQKA